MQPKLSVSVPLSRIMALGRFIALAASVVCLQAPALADQRQNGSEPNVSYYAPAANEETLLSHTRAVILSYRVGNRYGEVDIRGGNGRKLKMLIGGDLLVEGQVISCMDAPRPGYPVNEVMCPDWPDDIVLGHTLVTVTYWKDTINYRPLFVVSRIDITRSPFVP